MRPRPLALVCGAVLAASALLSAQNFAPPPAKQPDEATLKAIDDRMTRLSRLLAGLRRQGVRDPWLAEVEVYRKAAEWAVRHQEFYHPDSAQWTLDALDRGLLRASQLAQGEFPWLHQTEHPVVRAYRSRVDDSVQPYAVTLPKGYARDLRNRWRVDVVLHGRDPSLTEVKFLHQHAGDAEAAAPAAQDYVRIDIYGRGNNAYRWAGEADVFEVMDAFVGVERLLSRDQVLDSERVVLRGFSMGGAGTWHLGLHRPDRWCLIGPGAGFTTTRGFVKDLPDKLPAYQEACLHIYDAVDYAENAFNVPVVAYAGADDPQLQAARNIQERLKPLRIPMTLLVAPNLGHQFPPAWQKKAEEAYAPLLDKGRKENPERVHFVTYTLKYPTCNWVEVLALDRHYDRAQVDAAKTEKGLTVETKNVRALRLGMPESAAGEVVVNIDGQTLTTRPWLSQSTALNLYLERKANTWQAVLPQKIMTERFRRVQKLSGLQGPIDDAFMSTFLCVRGTGKPWHEATHQYAEKNLERFEEEWDRYLRGQPQIKKDIDITEEDIAGNHLVLFGDPSSNSLIAQVLDGLPLQWTRDAITLGGQKYSAADHVPVLIYPSPLHTGRYVVLNSGHTFHADDFRGTNALLYPRLGDYAVLRLAPTDRDPLQTEAATAGIFDDYWQLTRK